jgi:hypothetical protein
MIAGIVAVLVGATGAEEAESGGQKKKNFHGLHGIRARDGEQREPVCKTEFHEPSQERNGGGEGGAAKRAGIGIRSAY